ncbi:hypothetical protein NTE28_003580 [Vibrio harveyi]|nr:hypothetical protein [Vibrio harveyi]
MNRKQLIKLNNPVKKLINSKWDKHFQSKLNREINKLNCIFETMPHAIYRFEITSNFEDDFLSLTISRGHYHQLNLEIGIGEHGRLCIILYDQNGMHIIKESPHELADDILRTWDEFWSELKINSYYLKIKYDIAAPNFREAKKKALIIYKDMSIGTSNNTIDSNISRCPIYKLILARTLFDMTKTNGVSPLDAANKLFSDYTTLKHEFRVISNELGIKALCSIYDTPLAGISRN